MADVLLVNYGLQYDLVNEEQRARYASHMAALSLRLDAFSERAGKFAVYRETSRVHARKEGEGCECTPVTQEPSRAGMERSAELNELARRAMHVPIVPLYDQTARMSYGHPQNISGTPRACDCTHFCYSPQLTRVFLHDVLDLLIHKERAG